MPIASLVGLSIPASALGYDVVRYLISPDLAFATVSGTFTLIQLGAGGNWEE